MVTFSKTKMWTRQEIKDVKLNSIQIKIKVTQLSIK